MRENQLNEAQRLRISVLLSIHRALLGELGSSVRAVSCSWDDSEIRVSITHDKQIDEEDIESASCVETEIIADFPDHEVVVNCNRVDYPEAISLDDDASLIFQRREP